MVTSHRMCWTSLYGVQPLVADPGIIPPNHTVVGFGCLGVDGVVGEDSQRRDLLVPHAKWNRTSKRHIWMGKWRFFLLMPCISPL